MLRKIKVFFVTIILITSCERYESDCDSCLTDVVNSPVSLSYPNSFPTPDLPIDYELTEEGVNLGRHLFYDPILSSNGTISCATCHKQEFAFGDNTQYSPGFNNILGDRNVPTIINLAFQSTFDWDGKSISMEHQAIRPIFNEIELHNNNWDEVILRLENSGLYLELFCEAYGTSIIDSSKILNALTQFETILVSSESKFDKWMKGEYQPTPEEIDGFNIYATERGDCFHCHPVGLFTDNMFHNNGLDTDFTDLGRYNVTGNILDQGVFKSPSLRNIEYSAPYMHDGRFNTLDQVIEHYNSGGFDSPTVDPLMKYIYTNPYDIPGLTGLLLTEQEKINLKAFLLTLSDESFISNIDFSNPFN